MFEQKLIGTVRSVTSGSISVLLDSVVTSLKKELNGKTYFIGQIGTYVLIPVGKNTTCPKTER
jgi:hypothetical protein